MDYSNVISLNQMIRRYRFFVISLALLVSFSYLTLQLGFSFWLSGSSLGLVLLMFIAITAEPVFLDQASWQRMFLIFSAGVLAALIIAYSFFDNEVAARTSQLLYAGRLVGILSVMVYIFLVSHFARLEIVSLISGALLLVGPFGIAALSLILAMNIMQIQPFDNHSLVGLQDGWMIANRMFEDTGVAYNALKYAEESRRSLVYGEPSYLAVSLFSLSFLSLLSSRLVYIFVSRPSGAQIESRFLDGSLCLIGKLNRGSFLVSVPALVLTGSFWGFVYTLFLLICNSFAFRSPLAVTRPPRLTLKFIGLGAVILAAGLHDLFSFLSVYLDRAVRIFSGTDASASNRVYAFELWQDALARLVGLGPSLQSEILKRGFESVDVGVIAFLLYYGLPFALFMVAMFCVFNYRFSVYSLWLYLFVVLVWCQSGNLLAVDKLFLVSTPILLVSCWETLMRWQLSANNLKLF